MSLKKQSIELHVIREKFVESLLNLHRSLGDPDRVHIVIIVELTCCLVAIYLAAGVVNVEFGWHHLSPRS